MSVSVFAHPLLSGLLGDDEAAELFAWPAELAAMLRFEVALAEAQAATGDIPADAASAIAAACRGFSPDMGTLRAATARDGVVVPGLVAQLREAAGAYGDDVHRGATSQDVVDTALVLRIGPLTDLVTQRIDAVVAQLDALDAAYGDRALDARTRMRRALPIRVGTRVAAWREPLPRLRARIGRASSEARVVQLGGPVGDGASLGTSGPEIVRHVADSLGLAMPERAWHTQRDRLIAFATDLSALTGALGKIGQDVALMAQDGIDEVSLAGGGGSSSMPHKANPVAAEALVALARFTAGQTGLLHQAAVHEQERSGTAWTLEWMTLPPVCVATAAALANAQRLLDGVQGLGAPAA